MYEKIVTHYYFYIIYIDAGVSRQRRTCTTICCDQYGKISILDGTCEFEEDETYIVPSYSF